jgi:hypothetical protein
MQITDLDLRPCLIEKFPISFKDEVKDISKIEKKIDQHEYLKQRKKRLKAKLAKYNV